MIHLATRNCVPCKAGVEALRDPQLAKLLSQVPHWQLNETGDSIKRTFKFKNYYQTIAFVNALAYIFHQQDHHADLEVGYNRCQVLFTTHAIGGLSENDFICAAQINELVADKTISNG